MVDGLLEWGGGCTAGAANPFGGKEHPDGDVHASPAEGALAVGGGRDGRGAAEARGGEDGDGGERPAG